MLALAKDVYKFVQILIWTLWNSKLFKCYPQMSGIKSLAYDNIEASVHMYIIGRNVRSDIFVQTAKNLNTWYYTMYEMNFSSSHNKVFKCSDAGPFCFERNDQMDFRLRLWLWQMEYHPFAFLAANRIISHVVPLNILYSSFYLT